MCFIERALKLQQLMKVIHQVSFTTQFTLSVHKIRTYQHNLSKLKFLLNARRFLNVSLIAAATSVISSLSVLPTIL